MNEDIQTSEYDKVSESDDDDDDQMKLNVVQLDEVDQDNILLENILFLAVELLKDDEKGEKKMEERRQEIKETKFVSSF